MEEFEDREGLCQRTEEKADVCNELLELLQRDCSEDNLWKVVIAFQGVDFLTASGLPFTYSVKRGRNGNYNKELVIDRRNQSKTLTWSSIVLAFNNAMKMTGEIVVRPKALGDIRGVSYIYPMLYRFGIIRVPEKIEEKWRS